MQKYQPDHWQLGSGLPNTVSRRHFVLGAGGALLAGCGRLPWQGQPLAKVPRIGFLGSGAAADFEGFRGGLQDLGYVEGQNILIEVRDPGEQTERLPELAAALVALPVDILVAASAPQTAAAKQATSTIPIVFVYHSDPVGLGHVASLARPGGNVTGTSFLGNELAPKRLQLLCDAIPGLARVAVLSPTDDPSGSRGLGEMRKAAAVLGVDLQLLIVRSSEDFAGAFELVLGEQAQALTWMGSSVYGATNARRIAEFAKQNHLPTIGDYRAFAVNGGLMAYAADGMAVRRRSAYYVDRILRGTKPADLPVEQPMTFDSTFR